MSKKIYSFKSNYTSSTKSFKNTKVIQYYFAAFFGKIFYFILIIASIFMMNFSISNTDFTNILRENILFISKPIFIIAELPFNTLFNFANGIKNILLTNIRNEQLTKENILLRKLYIESKDILAENNNLKKLLNFKDTIENNYNYITSRIYATSKNGMNSIITINLGNKDGIKEGWILMILLG